jgi:uncharacterized protein HemY
MGDYILAVTTCRDGLARHPGYVSAQVTLGRALVELQEYAEARKELEAVLQVAPDNLAGHSRARRAPRTRSRQRAHDCTARRSRTAIV